MVFCDSLWPDHTRSLRSYTDLHCNEVLVCRFLDLAFKMLHLDWGPVGLWRSCCDIYLVLGIVLRGLVLYSRDLNLGARN